MLACHSNHWNRIVRNTTRINAIDSQSEALIEHLARGRGSRKPLKCGLGPIIYKPRPPRGSVCDQLSILSGASRKFSLAARIFHAIIPWTTSIACKTRPKAEADKEMPSEPTRFPADLNGV